MEIYQYEPGAYYDGSAYVNTEADPYYFIAMVYEEAGGQHYLQTYMTKQ